MPEKLTTTINKISSVPNPTNSTIIQEFSIYMKENGSSEHHQNNNLKAVISFAKFLGSHPTFYDIRKKEQIILIEILSCRILFSFFSSIPGEYRNAS